MHRHLFVTLLVSLILFFRVALRSNFELETDLEFDSISSTSSSCWDVNTVQPASYIEDENKTLRDARAHLDEFDVQACFDDDKHVLSIHLLNLTCLSRSVIVNQIFSKLHVNFSTDNSNHLQRTQTIFESDVHELASQLGSTEEVLADIVKAIESANKLRSFELLFEEVVHGIASEPSKDAKTNKLIKDLQMGHASFRMRLAGPTLILGECKAVPATEVHLPTNYLTGCSYTCKAEIRVSGTYHVEVLLLYSNDDAVVDGTRMRRLLGRWVVWQSFQLQGYFQNLTEFENDLASQDLPSCASLIRTSLPYSEQLQGIWTIPSYGTRGYEDDLNLVPGWKWLRSSIVNGDKNFYMAPVLSDNSSQKLGHLRTDKSFNLNRSMVKFVPINCRFKQGRSREEDRSCLKDQWLEMIGDSQTRTTFRHIQERVGDSDLCSRGNEKRCYNRFVKWTEQQNSSTSHLRLRLFWQPKLLPIDSDLTKNLSLVCDATPQLFSDCVSPNILMVNAGQHLVSWRVEEYRTALKTTLALYQNKVVQMQQQFPNEKHQLFWLQTFPFPLRFDKDSIRFRDGRTSFRIQLFNHVAREVIAELASDLKINIVDIWSIASTLSDFAPDSFHFGDVQLRPFVDLLMSLSC